MAEKIARMPAESMRFRQSYADEGKGGISSNESAADTCSTTLEPTDTRPKEREF